MSHDIQHPRSVHPRQNLGAEIEAFMTHLTEKAGDRPLTYLSVKVCVTQANWVVIIAVMVSF